MSTNVGSMPGGLAAAGRPRLDREPGTATRIVSTVLLLAGHTAWSANLGTRSALQRATNRDLAVARVPTLPSPMLPPGSRYGLFAKLF